MKAAANEFTRIKWPRLNLLPQTTFERYWRAIKAVAIEITPKVIAQTPKVMKYV